MGISGIHEARTRLQPRRIRGHGQGKQGATYVNRSRPQCGLHLGHSRTNRRCLVPGFDMAAPYYRPLALLLPLLCLGLLHADSATSITAGTPNGSELWGYVKVWPSDTEGPKERPEGGVNGSRLKIIAIGKIGLVPKYTPNPRVLGTVWNSYGGATPTQKVLGTSKNDCGSKHEKTAQKTAWYPSPVDPTYVSWVASVQPMSRAGSREKRSPVDPMW